MSLAVKGSSSKMPTRWPTPSLPWAYSESNP